MYGKRAIKLGKKADPLACFSYPELKNLCLAGSSLCKSDFWVAIALKADPKFQQNKSENSDTISRAVNSHGPPNKGKKMSSNNKQTSPHVASRAAEVLKDTNASDVAKRLAGSALAQSRSGRQTGAELEDLASRVLRSDKYADTTKELAASVLAQSNKAR